MLIKFTEENHIFYFKRIIRVIKDWKIRSYKGNFTNVIIDLYLIT